MEKFDELEQAVAQNIADGTPPHWPVATDLTSEERATIDALRGVALISALHRHVRERGALKPGDCWGPLRIVHRVGGGTGGDVYLASDLRLDRRVALKLLASHPKDGASTVDEARMLASVRHPHVLTVYGAEIIDGQAGIWTEFIDGRTLEEILAGEGPLSRAEVIRIGVALCRAVDAVHHAGLLHRDIKLHNVMVEADGRVVLMDFGTSARHSDPSRLAGTPLYLAPELLSGDPPSVQSDVYAIGVVLFRLLTGRYPVEGATLEDVRSNHVTTGTSALSGWPAGDRLGEAIRRALDPRRNRRFATAAGFAAALEAQVEVAPAARRLRPIRTAIALVLTVGIAGLVGTLVRSRTATEPAVGGTVLVSDVENRTGNAALAPLIHDAVDRTLAGSGPLHATPRSEVSATLRLMQRPTDAAVTGVVADEIAARSRNVRVVLAEEIQMAPPGVVLTLSVRQAEGGRTLFRTSSSARHETDVPRAAAAAADAVREFLARAPAEDFARRVVLERVTTRSLAALQNYSRAFTLGRRGNWLAALPFAEQAVREDPDFALAYTELAWAMVNLDRPRTEVTAVAAKGVTLAAAHPEDERLWATATYQHLSGDLASAGATYAALLRIRPDHAPAAEELANLQPPGTGAVEYLLRAADLSPGDAGINAIAANRLQIEGTADQRALEYQRRARAALDRGAELPPGAIARVLLLPAGFAWRRHQDPRETTAAFERAALDPLAADPLVASSISLNAALFHLAAGQPTAAVAALAGSTNYFDNQLQRGHIALAEGDVTTARAALSHVRLHRSDRSQGTPQTPLAFWLFVRAGMLERADALAADYDSYTSPGAAVALRPLLDHARGKHESCVRELAPSVSRSVAGGGPLYRNALVASECLVAIGKPTDAATLLDHIVNLPSLDGPGVDWGIARAADRLRLAALYNLLGRPQDADMQRTLVMRQFVDAEPGFMLKVEAQVTRDLQGR